MNKIEELRKKLIDSAKKKVQQKYEEKDVHIIKSVNILDDIDPISNILVEQLREWHSVHFPELNDLVPDNDQYLKLVYHLGKRENFTQKNVSDQLNNGEVAQTIQEAAEKSIGSGISDGDLNEMKLLALNCLNLKDEREHISKYLENAMKKELPNFTELAGAVIGAKILAKIGSKKRLAFAPASTIQMTGAEKALFMHIKKGVNGPKYGYLYQHPLVKAAKAVDKGRLARTIASKLSIAAKMDYFGSLENVDEIKKDIEKRAENMHGARKKPAKETPKHQYNPRSYERMESGKFDPAPRYTEDRQFAKRRVFRREGRKGDRKSFSNPSFERSSMPQRSFEGGKMDSRNRFGKMGKSKTFGMDQRKPFDKDAKSFEGRSGFRPRGKSHGGRGRKFDHNKRMKFG